MVESCCEGLCCLGRRRGCAGGGGGVNFEGEGKTVRLGLVGGKVSKPSLPQLRGSVQDMGKPLGPLQAPPRPFLIAHGTLPPSPPTHLPPCYRCAALCEMWGSSRSAASSVRRPTNSMRRKCWRQRQPAAPALRKCDGAIDAATRLQPAARTSSNEEEVPVAAAAS